MSVSFTYHRETTVTYVIEICADGPLAMQKGLMRVIADVVTSGRSYQITRTIKPFSVESGTAELTGYIFDAVAKKHDEIVNPSRVHNGLRYSMPVPAFTY